jgi:hypothetical protein
MNQAKSLSIIIFISLTCSLHIWSSTNSQTTLVCLLMGITLNGYYDRLLIGYATLMAHMLSMLSSIRLSTHKTTTPSYNGIFAHRPSIASYIGLSTHGPSIPSYDNLSIFGPSMSSMPSLCYRCTFGPPGLALA